MLLLVSVSKKKEKYGHLLNFPIELLGFKNNIEVMMEVLMYFHKGSTYAFLLIPRETKQEKFSEVRHLQTPWVEGGQPDTRTQAFLLAGQIYTPYNLVLLKSAESACLPHPRRSLTIKGQMI